MFYLIELPVTTPHSNISYKRTHVYEGVERIPGILCCFESRLRFQSNDFSCIYERNKASFCVARCMCKKISSIC